MRAPALVAAVLAATTAAAAERLPLGLELGAQTTLVGQAVPGVRGRRENPDLSFATRDAVGWSTTVTLYGAVSPWPLATLVVEPEYANGRGLPNASGAAAYPNGEIVRVPSLGSEPYVARAFVHQELPLGPAREADEPEREERFSPTVGGPGLRGRPRSPTRVELVAGKVAANDLFDASALGSDPRHHFMSWALMAQGAWDYPADTRGYTWGVAAALETPRAAVRAGLFLMPTVANGPVYDGDVLHARGQVLEGEWRYGGAGRRGSARLLLYANRARMGDYDAALAAAAPGEPPSVAATRRRGAAKYGAGLLVDQELGAAGRAFLRAGWNDGRTETFAFTEIDRSASGGVELAGARWGRDRDRVALGVAVSGLSRSHRRYLAAGGAGFQLGDGGLSYRPEVAVEAYYAAAFGPVEATLDLQLLSAPGMNADRGPGFVGGVRLHAHR